MRPRTIGEHLRKRRLDLGLTRTGLAAQLGADPGTVANWEEERTRPAIRFLPAIHDFLGYCPLQPALSVGDRLRLFREAAGLSRRELARRLGLDEGTVIRFGRGSTKRPACRTLYAVGSLLQGRSS